MEVREAALHYAGQGVPVFPAGEDKRPRVKDWPNVASTDPDRIREWWSRWPDAGVAIVTGSRSGIVAIDLDGDSVGGDTYGRMLLEHGAPGTDDYTDGASVRTGREDGGWRLLFRIPAGVTIRKGTFGAGVEYMGDGGSAILPPSRHATGRRYTWCERIPLDRLPQLSMAWVDLMTRSRSTVPLAPPAVGVDMQDDGTSYGLAALRGELQRLSAAEPGTRNETLNAAAFAVGSLAAAGHLNAQSAATELVRAAADIGLSEEEIRATLTSGLRAGAQSPRDKAAS